MSAGLPPQPRQLRQIVETEESRHVGICAKPIIYHVHSLSARDGCAVFVRLHFLCLRPDAQLLWKCFDEGSCQLGVQGLEPGGRVPSQFLKRCVLNFFEPCNLLLVVVW